MVESNQWGRWICTVYNTFPRHDGVPRCNSLLDRLIRRSRVYHNGPGAVDVCLKHKPVGSCCNRADSGQSQFLELACFQARWIIICMNFQKEDLTLPYWLIASGVDAKIAHGWFLWTASINVQTRSNAQPFTVSWSSSQSYRRSDTKQHEDIWWK